jgi:hypothetical protein
MDEIISYKMCAVKVRNVKLRNYLKGLITWTGPARLTGLKNVTKIFLGPQNEF